MTIYFSASWLPSLTQHSSVRTRLSCTNTPVKSHTDLMTITDHCITIPCSACTLPPSGDESRSSSCPSSKRWKGAMSAEGRPVKRWSLTEGGEGLSDQRQQRIPFMPRGSGAGPSSVSLCCTVPLYGRLRLQVSLVPEWRESTALFDL